MKFSSAFNTMVQWCLTPHFKIMPPFSIAASFSQNDNDKWKINKIINEHSADFHTSLQY